MLLEAFLFIVIYYNNEIKNERRSSKDEDQMYMYF